MSLLAWVLAFALPTGVVEAVRIDQVGSRPVVTVVMRGGSGVVGVRREGREVIVLVDAIVASGLRLPKEVPPLEGLRATAEKGGTALRLTVPESVPYQILRTETSLSVVLGPLEPTTDRPLGERPSARDLRARPRAETPLRRVSFDPPAPPSSPHPGEPGRSVVPPVPAAAPTRVVEAVRIDQVGSRPAVTVVTRGGSGPVAVRREGREVIVTVGATLPPGLRLPKEMPPLEGLSATAEPDGIALHLTVPESVPYQILRTLTTVSVVLGAPEPTTEVPMAERRSAQELYPRIFAVPSDDATTSSDPAAEGGVLRRDEDREGFYIGFVRLRPSVLLSYIDAQATLFDTPQPSRQRYFEVDPRLGLGLGVGTTLSLFGGTLDVQYEPRFRSSVSLAALRRPSHLLTARATLPVGSAVTLRASHKYTRGFLETTEVDPGGEYFFDLGHFIHNETEVGARVETGSRVDFDVAAAREVLEIEDTAAFFDHRKDRLTLGPGYALRPDLRASLNYTIEHVPPPERRPQAQSDLDRLTVGLEGELLPLVRGLARVGFEDRKAPRAAPGGERFRGFVAQVSLEKEFTPSSRLSLTGRRSTELSFFEDNAFYISTRADASQTLELPFFLSLRVSAGRQRNRYRTVAASLREPRVDDIFGWSVGLGRGFTRWAYLRADYRHEQRRSNLDVFRVTTHALVLQVGIGYLQNTRP